MINKQSRSLKTLCTSTKTTTCILPAPKNKFYLLLLIFIFRHSFTCLINRSISERVHQPIIKLIYSHNRRLFVGSIAIPRNTTSNQSLVFYVKPPLREGYMSTQLFIYDDVYSVQEATFWTTVRLWWTHKTAQSRAMLNNNKALHASYSFRIYDVRLANLMPHWNCAHINHSTTYGS